MQQKTSITFSGIIRTTVAWQQSCDRRQHFVIELNQFQWFLNKYNFCLCGKGIPSPFLDTAMLHVAQADLVTPNVLYANQGSSAKTHTVSQYRTVLHYSLSIPTSDRVTVWYSDSGGPPRSGMPYPLKCDSLHYVSYLKNTWKLTILNSLL